MSTETIAAVSTGGSSSGINIIRISGNNAKKIVDNIFTNHEKLEHQKIIYGKIINPSNNMVLDEVLVSYFKAPNSFTGEDVCEINCHGGRKVTMEILNLVINYGARMAHPGEFSKRAFLNGKMDLSKAEAIIDMINAKTKLQAKLAMSQLEGGIYDRVEEIREKIVSLMAEIEVGIDYPEYDYEKLTQASLISRLEKLKEDISKLIKTHNEGKYIKEGVNVAIIGNTNAGKSSLLNALLNEEKAIVTDIEGTTRDVIEETIIIGNLVLNISDTAGIRDTNDVVEKIGINRSLKKIEDTDIIIYLIDVNRGIEKIDFETLNKIHNLNKPYIIGLNKVDISREKCLEIKDKLSNFKNIILLSAKTKEGIEDIKNKIQEIFNVSSFENTENLIIVNERHNELLLKAKSEIDKAIEITKEGEFIDIITINLNEVISLLGNITGKDTSNDVINKIFEKFCLGK